MKKLFPKKPCICCGKLSFYGKPFTICRKCREIVDIWERHQIKHRQEMKARRNQDGRE